MNQSTSFDIDLLEKINTNLEQQLTEAVELGKISDKYEPIKYRMAGESNDSYIKRVRDFSLCKQFVDVVLHGKAKYVAFSMVGPIVTKKGTFELIPAEVVGGSWSIHYCLFYPNLETVLKQENVFLRLDSGCISGQLFGDATCDCKQQLDISLEMCVKNGSGIVISIPKHDGRGWGEYKMANQLLMKDLNIDTVAAARFFYGKETSIDQRSFDEAVIILLAFGFNATHKFYLGTNNPRKIGAFNALGLQLSQVTSIVAQNVNNSVRRNMDAKKSEWRHRL